jgi:hypothetical protein
VASASKIPIQGQVRKAAKCGILFLSQAGRGIPITKKFSGSLLKDVSGNIYAR